jgi:hypothetical protein
MRCLAKPRRVFQHSIERRREAAGRRIDNLQDFGGRGLPLVCLFQLAGENVYLILKVGN